MELSLLAGATDMLLAGLCSSLIGGVFWRRRGSRGRKAVAAAQDLALPDNLAAPQDDSAQMLARYQAGMDAATIARIFEPFSRRSLPGAGLGLLQCRVLFARIMARSRLPVCMAQARRSIYCCRLLGMLRQHGRQHSQRLGRAQAPCC